MKEVISKENNREKTYLDKVNTKIKWKLRHFRNFIADATPIQRPYIFGWLMVLIALFLALLAKVPIVIFVASIITIAVAFLIKNISFVTRKIQEIFDYLDVRKSLTLAFVLCIYVIIGYYALYKNDSFSPTLINLAIGIIVGIAVCCFIFGFAYEVFLLWDSKKEVFKSIFSLLAAGTSFISILLARWVIVYCTGVEPATLSASSILFSVALGVMIWILLCIVVLMAIYFLTLFLTVIAVTFLPYLFSFINIKNSGSWRFVFRKSKQGTIENNSQIIIKKTNKFCLYFMGRALGASLIGTILGYSVCYCANTILLDYNIPLVSSIEKIIVYTDYRPSNKITECSNLEDREWGLLVSNKLISVAKPKSSGGYSFLTKPCIFEDNSF